MQIYPMRDRFVFISNDLSFCIFILIINHLTYIMKHLYSYIYMNDRYREECSVSVEVKISEKFYLEEGRGVEELQELSIEDVLNWEDYHSFIQTKGHLYVKGYYLHEDGHYDQSEKLHYPERKYLDHIEEINESESLFTQTIPIDVTIPKDKV